MISADKFTPTTSASRSVHAASLSHPVVSLPHSCCLHCAVMRAAVCCDACVLWWVLQCAVMSARSHPLTRFVSLRCATQHTPFKWFMHIMVLGWDVDLETSSLISELNSAIAFLSQHLIIRKINQIISRRDKWKNSKIAAVQETSKRVVQDTTEKHHKRSFLQDCSTLESQHAWTASPFSDWINQHAVFLVVRSQEAPKNEIYDLIILKLETRVGGSEALRMITLYFSL